MTIGLSKWFKATFLGIEEKTVRARDEDGKYVGDDKSTPDINEAYKTVKVVKAKKRRIKPAQKKRQRRRGIK